MATKKTTGAKATEKTATKTDATKKVVAKAAAAAEPIVEVKAAKAEVAVEAKPAKVEAKAAAKDVAAPVVRAATVSPSQEAIAKRAFELFVARGGANGNAFEDWLRAERELAAR